MSLQTLINLQVRIARSERRLNRLKAMSAPHCVIQLEQRNLARLEAIERQAIAEDLRQAA